MSDYPPDDRQGRKDGPAPSDKVKIRISEEELQRRLQPKGGRTLAEILANLEQRT